jgi:NAD(P)-dependent dehydrogenase (short-subunit alcohol dehydrogenase family)
MSLVVLNPASEQPIAELDRAGAEEADAAVARAKAAYSGWRAVSPSDRGRLLRRLATLVEEHAEELARIESGNVILDTSVEAWQRVQDVNTKGVFLCCKHGIPYLRRRGGGSVINVASFVAILGAATSQISYTASKGAVLAMSRELAVQFAREGVRVNALCPGPVETPLLLNIFGDDRAALERRRIHWPTGRLAKPREVVNGALFLASDDSSYVTGSTFLVDGGLTAAYVTPL